MKRFQSMKFVNVPVVVDVICNKCGNTCRPHAHAMNFEHANVDVSWGYESNKDCESHHWDVCETCYDEIVATFKLPPTQRNYMDGQRSGPYEEHGFLSKIPSYPRISPSRVTDKDFADFREDVESAAQERGFQEGALGTMMRTFDRTEVELMWRAVSEFTTGTARAQVPDDQREAWSALDSKLTTLANDGLKPTTVAGKERPDE